MIKNIAKNNEGIAFKFLIFLICLFVFTNYSYNIQAPFIIILVFVTIIVFRFSGFFKIHLYIEDIFSIIYSLYLFLNVFIAQNIQEAVKYSIVFLSLTITTIFFKNSSINVKRIIKWMLLLSLIHVAMTLLYPIVPNIVRYVASLFLTADKLQDNIYMFDIQHINCGITQIQSLNGFYISLFITIIFSYVITESKININKIICLIFGIIALCFTSKRGILLANIMAIITISFVLGKFKLNKDSIKIFIISIIFVAVTYFIINHYFSGAMIMFDRFTNQSDISTGRFDMYKETWKLFNESPVVGSGLFSNRYILDNNDAHNIYLQLLSEIGIIGFLLFILIILINLVKNLRIIKYAKKIENRSLLQEAVFSLYFQVFFLFYGITGNVIFDITMLLSYFISIWVFNIAYTNLMARREFN